MQRTFPTEGHFSKSRNITNLPNTKNTHSNLSEMRQQRNIFQMKDQDITPEEKLTEMEIGNPLEKEFRVITVKMIQDLRK